MTIGTRLFTRFKGRLINHDQAGNLYYEERQARAGMKARRWVVYPGDADASSVPPEWHAWLHFTTDAPLTVAHRAWQKPHQPNATGTAAGYRPPGHDYRGGQRAAATGDYESWTPGS